MTDERFNFRIWILAAVVAMLSATAGITLWNLVQMRQEPLFSALIVLPEPRVIDEFELQDDRERRFSLDRLRGHWTLMFFGFTHCPDVCPTSLFELQNLKQRLAEDATGIDLPQIVFVSVDPERDTPEKLRQYVSYFDPDFTGVSGLHENLTPFTRQAGIAYRIEEHEPGRADYAVDHSSSILLFGPDGKLHGVFPAPHRSEVMAADLETLLEP